MSLREFARQIGVSDTAVRKAITAGRLRNSLGKDAKDRPLIIDLEGAKAEWNATSRTAAGVRTKTANQTAAGSQSASVAAAKPIVVPPSAPAPRQQVEESPVDADEPGEEAGGQLVFAKTLIDAQTLATNERARKLKYENDVTEGRLVPIEKITKEAFEAERIIRESMLNLPPRIAGALAAETDTGRVHRMLEAAIREALNGAADALLVVNE